MTYKEMLQLFVEHGINFGYDDAAELLKLSCPGDHIRNAPMCSCLTEDEKCVYGDCKDCWDQEMPIPKLPKEDKE